MQVDVVYAVPEQQTLITVSLDEASTVQTVIEQSGILNTVPEIDLATCKVGIWGKFVELTQAVQADDRIEIYRPLTIDPMEARRIRAEKKH